MVFSHTKIPSSQQKIFFELHYKYVCTRDLMGNPSNQSSAPNHSSNIRRTYLNAWNLNRFKQ